jgi:hypothetical protein
MTKRTLDHSYSDISRYSATLAEYRESSTISEKFNLLKKIVADNQNNTIDDVYQSLIKNNFRKLAKYPGWIMMYMPARYGNYLAVVWYDSYESANHTIELIEKKYTTLEFPSAAVKGYKIPDFGTLYAILLDRVDPVDQDEVGGREFLEFLEKNISKNIEGIIEEFTQQYNLNPKKYNLLSLEEYVNLIEYFSYTLYLYQDNRFVVSLTKRQAIFRDAITNKLVIIHPIYW